jgi:hypothetical protein
MRTTLTLDDELVDALKQKAVRDRRPFKEIVNTTLRAGLVASTQPSPKPYRLEPVSLGRAMPGINLDKALSLADSLEDEELLRKLELRK